MEPFERELRLLLQRHDPSRDFTARVTEAAFAAKPAPVAAFPASRRRPSNWRWAVGAMAASLAVGAIVVRQQAADRRSAERAEAELIETLFVTSEKISQARDRVWGSNANADGSVRSGE